MTLEQFALIAEIVGGVAVLITLVYFLVEIRRNTEAVRSSTHQQQVDTTVTIHSNVSNDPALAKLIAKANENFKSLDVGEQLQLLYFYTNYFNMWHFQFTNMKKGIFDSEAWRVWDDGWSKLLANQAGMRETWGAMGDIYGTEFRQHIDRLIGAFELEENHTGTLKNMLSNGAT